MISHNLPRIKKATSLHGPRDNKENCSNNVQQCHQPLAKLGKIRESFANPSNNIEKVVSCLTIDSKEERLTLDRQLKKEYTWLLKKDYS